MTTSRRLLATRSSKWVIGVILSAASAALVAMYFALLQAPAAGTFHDDGIYLVTAKALAEDQGYRIISIPGEPPQTKYPILFPWLVSVAWRLYPSFPANLPWLRLVPLIATFAWLALSWLLLRRLGASRREAAAIVVLTAISPWVAFLSTAMMSETLFAAFLAAALLMITRSHQNDATRVDPLAAGVFLGAATLTRIAGIAPALAGVVVLVAEKRWRSAIEYVAGYVVVTMPWFWWVGHQTMAATTVDPYYSVTNYASWNVVASYTWIEKLIVVAANVIQMGMTVVHTWHVPAPSALALPLVAVGLAVLTRAFWRERREAATLLTLAYCGVHVAWVWPPLRFLVPVIPLLLWFSFLGAGRSKRIGGVVALVLFAAGGAQFWRLVAQARETGVASPFAGSEDWNQTSSLLAWASRETRADAVLTGNLDPMYYLFTGRKSVRAFTASPLLLYYNLRRQSGNPLGTLDDFRNRLVAIKADYLIVTPSGGFGEIPHLDRLVAELSSACQGSLAPAVTGRDPRYVIYRIDRRRLENGDTCRADVSSRAGDVSGRR